jgi:hypothetical protein
MADNMSGKAKGGHARAEALSDEQRSEIARRGALARWETPTALRSGQLQIGEIVIDCAVLPDGTRVLSERAISRAFGAKRGGSHWRRKKAGGDGADLPVFLSAKNLLPCISNGILEFPYPSRRGR